MNSPLLAALLKFDHITARGVYLSPEQATAVREALGGRLAVRERVRMATEGGGTAGDEERMYRVLVEMDGVKER